MRGIDRIVTDTGPLLALGIINRLDLLVNLYASVYVPTEVKRELERGAVKYEDARNALEAVNKGWLIETSVEQIFCKRIEKLMAGPPKLGKAQAESIVSCKQLNINLLLVDDEDAVKVAQREGIRTVHGLDTLVNSAKMGSISPSQALNYINKFREIGEYGEEDLREAEERIKSVMQGSKSHDQS
jgi:predicted nucleic acid-binding protein